MKKLMSFLFLCALSGLLGFSSPLAFLSQFANPNPEALGTSAWVEKEIHLLKSQAKNIDTNVLRLSLTAYQQARKKGFGERQLLTVIDYSKPSTEKRLWVFDLKRGKTLINTWVSHGKNSGGLNAESFSNKPGSLKSSIGLFSTDYQPYEGGNGYSLRLRGLEQGINDNAYNRDIVVHGASYVNADTIHRYGAIGRSWGCPAVSPKLAKSLIDTIKSNTLLFAYYPDRQWLRHSRFLTA